MKKLILICLAMSMFTCTKMDHSPFSDPSTPNKPATDRDPEPGEPCCPLEIMITSDDAPSSGSYKSEWQILPSQSSTANWTGVRSRECNETTIQLNTWYSVGACPGSYRISYSRVTPCGENWAIGTSQVKIRSVNTECSYTITTTTSSNPVYVNFDVVKILSSCSLSCGEGSIY
ncbi:MAG: hypothetical protein ABMA02_01590 [Saprospiraceae bacterium]